MKTLLIVATLTLTACGGSQDKADQKLSDPPTDAQPYEAPKGPEIVADSIRPSTTREVEQGVSSESADIVAKADVEAFRRKGPSYALTQVVVDPVHGGSGFEGYKLLSATASVTSFLAPQLQVGDVITHLNGIKIERPDDYLQAWNRLADAEVLSIDFLRDGQKMAAQWQVK